MKNRGEILQIMKSLFYGAICSSFFSFLILSAHHHSSKEMHAQGDNENGSYEQHNEEFKDNSSTPEPSCDQERTQDDKSSQQDEKKIPRNKVCPCGSKKKYKACCGSISGRSSAKFVINQTVDYGKSRKERKQGKKGGPANAANSHESEGGPPDVGALCI